MHRIIRKSLLGLARAVGQKMQEQMGQTVIVENKPGATGNIGADLVAKSPQQFGQFISSEKARWAKVVAESGAKFD